MKRMLAVLLLCALLCGCAAGEPLTKECELFMINVGKGDAILVFIEGDVYLIDAALDTAWGRVRMALAEKNVTKLKGVFLTHADGDHYGGLMQLAKSDVEVEAWYASGYCASFKEKKHPAVRAAAARGQSVNWLYAGDCVDDRFSVLAPTQLNESKEDNNSLVMRLNTQCGSVLLTGDMELPQENALYAAGVDFSCDVLKVPNHADSDAAGANLISSAGASIALISTDPYEKKGTPDAGVLARLESAGTRVFRTDMSEMGISVKLDENGASAEYVNWQNRPALCDDARIASVDAAADTVRLESASDVDLSGWYLYSERGGDLMMFPQGTRIMAGEPLVVGSRSAEEGAYDLLWDEKNVIHNSKEDCVVLYDAYGRLINYLLSDPA